MWYSDLCIPEVNGYILFNRKIKNKKVLKGCQEINWLLQFPDWSEPSTESKFSASKKSK